MSERPTTSCSQI